MAKLRTNHGGRGKGASSGTIARVGIFGAIIAALAWGFQQYVGGSSEETERIDYAGEAYYLPTGGEGEVVRHQGFSLSYFEEWEQAEWTAHILTRENLERTGLSGRITSARTPPCPLVRLPTTTTAAPVTIVATWFPGPIWPGTLAGWMNLTT